MSDSKSKVDDAKLIDTKKSATTSSQGTTPKAEEEKKEEKKERSAEQKSNSFKKIRAYAGRECCSLTIGLIFLVLGMASDLLIPLFIGEVVDYLAAEEYDKVG